MVAFLVGEHGFWGTETSVVAALRLRSRGLQALVCACSVCENHSERAQSYLKDIALSWTVLSLGIGLYRLKFCKHSKINAFLEIGDLRGDCVKNPSSFLYSMIIYMYVCVCVLSVP